MVPVAQQHIPSAGLVITRQSIEASQQSAGPCMCTQVKGMWIAPCMSLANASILMAKGVEGQPHPRSTPLGALLWGVTTVV